LRDVLKVLSALRSLNEVELTRVQNGPEGVPLVGDVVCLHDGQQELLLLGGGFATEKG
jgi:hypothetical protein